MLTSPRQRWLSPPSPLSVAPLPSLCPHLLLLRGLQTERCSKDFPLASGNPRLVLCEEKGLKVTGVLSSDPTEMCSEVTGIIVLAEHGLGLRGARGVNSL